MVEAVMLTISNVEILSDVVGEEPEFPKYTTQLMNLANQNAQGTRPRVVGQMSELIKEFSGTCFEDWRTWYQIRMPQGIESASDRIYGMVLSLKEAIAQIDRAMVREWVEDLVLIKTFAGLRFQQSILKRVAMLRKTDYQTASAQEESQGIDGYVGGKAVSIKPVTYKTKPMLPEDIEIEMIYYEKEKSYIRVCAE
jgi:hypothetical protein